MSQTEFAKLIGIVKSTLTTWDLPHRKVANKKMYNAIECLKHEKVIAHIASRSKKSQQSELDKAKIAQLKAQTKKLNQEAKLKKLDLEEKQENSIPAKDIEFLWGMLVTNCKNKMRAIARPLSTAVATGKERRKAQKTILKFIDEALEELSNEDAYTQPNE